MNLQQNYELSRAKREKLAQIESEIPRRPAGHEQPRSRVGRKSRN